MMMMNLFARQQWRCRHREQTCGHGMNGESCMEMYTPPYVK